MTQSKHWVFTLNNYTDDEVSKIKSLAPSCHYLVIGFEVGDTGTPHLQGYVCFATTKRLSGAKIALSPRVHLEVKRGTPFEAATYCKKEGDFFEVGVVPTAAKASEYDLFVTWCQACPTIPSDRQIAREFPKLWLRFERKLRSLAHHLHPRPLLELDVVLHPWQSTLRDQLLGAADDRTITFMVDPVGNTGKTHFTRYMLTEYGEITQALSVGKRDDIAHAIDASKTVFLFNVPRGGMHFLQYTVLEQIKDRLVFSPKYDSTTKVFQHNTHVVVMCNEHPDWDKMSVDRFNVVELN